MDTRCVPKLNIPRSVHPGIAVKINGSPTVHIHLVLEDFVSFTIPVNRTQRCFSSCIHLLGDLAPGLLLKDKREWPTWRSRNEFIIKIPFPRSYILPLFYFSFFFSLVSFFFFFFFSREWKNCEGQVVKKKIVISSGTILLRGILERLLKKQFLLPSCFMVPWPWCAIDASNRLGTNLAVGRKKWFKNAAVNSGAE